MDEKTVSEPSREDHDDLLRQARDDFEKAVQAEKTNRDCGEESIKFARLGEQWPDNIRAQRENEGRPILTINRMNAFIRQVVNDGRQNKPAIKISPVDDEADVETARVLEGIIRQIEHASSADIAYDTALENAAQYWVGYVRVDVDYSHDDAFDQDIKIGRVLNPASVYGDPDSQSADGSDWNVAFVVEPVTKTEFEHRYGDKSQVGWDSDVWQGMDDGWKTDDYIQIAEYWTREEVTKNIHQLSNGIVVDDDRLENDPDLIALMETGMVGVERSRKSKGFKVTQRIISGAEVLEVNEWPGKFIPIVPVYGDEFNIEGKRHIRSLIWDAMDPQRMFNYWRTVSTELVALAPRVPYIGRKGAFDHDLNRWETANTHSHPFLEYEGEIPPQRQPLDGGVAAGALQEALNSSDDMKSVLGIYDASLGAKSNETSGRAIMARQREGDTSTFHFLDNQSRSIRQVGRLCLDLIPHVYSARRVMRVMGEDGSTEHVPMNAPRQIEKADGSVIEAMHDLSVGKYDVAVSTGPSFNTKREENAFYMMETMRGNPDLVPLMIDKIAKAQDWEGAEEIAERAKKLIPGANEELPPEIQQALMEAQQQAQELNSLKADKTLEQFKLEIDMFKAQTERMKAQAEIGKKAAEVEQIDENINTQIKERNQPQKEPAE